MDLGIDYSDTRPRPTVIRDQGYRFVARYIPYGGVAKGLRPDELAALRGAGLEVALIWERFGDWARDYSGGASKGRGDAVQAIGGARSLGYPAGCTIYHAIDFDATPAQLAGAVHQYAQAFRDFAHASGYRVGAYGSYDAIGYLFDHGLIDDGWQCYAWSEGRWDGRAAMRQVKNGIRVDGLDCDLDERRGPTYLMGGERKMLQYCKLGDRGWPVESLIRALIRAGASITLRLDQEAVYDDKVSAAVRELHLCDGFDESGNTFGPTEADRLDQLLNRREGTGVDPDRLQLLVDQAVRSAVARIRLDIPHEQPGPPGE